MRCSCGAALERPGIRQRLVGDLLEYCRCYARCGSTTTVLVETCGHGRARLEGDRWKCPDCGHAWTQHGEPSLCEIDARRSAQQAVESGYRRGY
jgi:transposase-like protein